MRLVGRDSELGEVERLLAGQRGPLLIDIVGDPGIGKSRLLAEVREIAEGRGGLVLEGRATEFERDLPFAPFVDALDHYVAAQERERLEDLGAERLAELGYILPSLAGPEGGAAAVIASERHRAHRAVASLLEVLAGPTPLLLSLDDVHWADDASVELLTGLLHRWPAAPLTIAIARRPRQTPARLAAALDAGARAGVVQQLELEPLTAAEADELLGGSVPDDRRELLYRESGGNPLYLETLQRASDPVRPRAAAMRPELPADASVPTAVLGALGDELSSLEDRPRLLLQGAAVARDPFDPELAAATAGIPEEEALGLIDVLSSVDLVRETELPRRFEFRHPLVRRAVYESSPPGWRLAAHDRAARALERIGASAAERAHHVERAARPGDADAIALLAEAGESVAPRAPSSAAHWYGAALRLAPADDAGTRLRLLIPLATALGTAGDLNASRERLLEALEILPEEAEEDRVRLTAFLAALEHLLGEHQHAHRRLQSALEALPDQASAPAASLRLELSADSLWTGDYEAMTDEGRIARELAREQGDRGLQAAAAALESMGEMGRGRPDRIDEPIDEAAALVDGLDDTAFAARLDAAYYLGHAELFAERFEPGLRHLERGIDVGRATGQGQLYVPVVIGQAWINLWLGRLEESGELAESALEAARLGGSRQGLHWAYLTQSLALLPVDLAAAREAAERAVELVPRLGDSLLAWATGWVTGWVLVEAAEPERALSAIEAGLGDPDREQRLLPQAMALSCFLATKAELACSRLDRARVWAERAERFAERCTPGIHAGFGRCARAIVLTAEGAAADAVDPALEAAAWAEAVGSEIMAARCRLIAARALSASGDDGRAADELERAYTALKRCGAVRWTDEAASELRALGRRVPRAASRKSAGELSPREREVAELVATGKTNREVGEVLFLSEKTVESHLRNVFAKLGISRRTQLAARLAAGEVPATASAGRDRDPG